MKRIYHLSEYKEDQAPSSPDMQLVGWMLPGCSNNSASDED